MTTNTLHLKLAHLSRDDNSMTFTFLDGLNLNDLDSYAAFEEEDGTYMFIPLKAVLKEKLYQDLVAISEESLDAIAQGNFLTIQELEERLLDD